MKNINLAIAVDQSVLDYEMNGVINDNAQDLVNTEDVISYVESRDSFISLKLHMKWVSASRKPYAGAKVAVLASTHQSQWVTEITHDGKNWVESDGSIFQFYISFWQYSFKN